ncbi:nSTAND1 domain-containing NTPase [Nonomuraea sp. LPB2021202275-12-8]|uniref:nSTAND1 domain-containing NTPase n=1 Tax=Nonomuraea sp. LPB2021202275-12-8 TaxID=3120159 RepID=UPI00300C99C2
MVIERLGGYWLGARLGGSVREAYDESGGRYALTLLDPPDDYEGLASWAATARRISSLRVARLVACDLDGDVPYLVSEYVEGVSVRSIVERHGPYHGDDLYRLAATTATALAAIHEAGATHGGLTPGRVLIGADGPRVIGPRPCADGGGPPGDVLAWGRLLHYAAYGSRRDPATGERDSRRVRADPPLDRRLRELITSALHEDPPHRPGARQLLLSLLDAPQSQQGRLLPPDPVDDPPLGARADDLYLKLPLPDQALVPEVFLRLIGVAADGADTRRPATREGLLSGRAPEQAAAIDRVLKTYGEAGVLDTAGNGSTTIAHAALLRAWPRLREWLDAERGGLGVHRELAGAARRWEEDGRRDADLFLDGALDRSLAWAAGGRRHLTLSATEQAFLDAGRALARRRARRRRAVTAALVAAAIAVVLVWQGGAADGRLEQAMAKVAASRAEAARMADPVTARKLGLAAWSLAPVEQARRALEGSAADPAVDVFADPHATDRSLHALSADGGRLASLADGTLRVFDLARREQVAEAGGPAQNVRAMAWSPDGRTLAMVGVDRSYLWDTTSTAGVGPPFGRGLGAPGEQAAWFSPGGGLLFAAARQSGERWAWDLRAGRATLVGEYAVAGPRDRVALVFSGRASHVRYLDTGATTERPWLDRMPWEYAAFAPDGERVAIAEETGIQIYRLDGVPTLPFRLQPSPGYLSFSADGRILAGTGSDRVRAWRVADGTLLAERQVSATGTDRPAQAAIGADGRWLRVLAGRGTVLTVDLAHPAGRQDPELSAAAVCERYGALSPAEWQRHLPELPYRELCG